MKGHTSPGSRLPGQRGPRNHLMQQLQTRLPSGRSVARLINWKWVVALLFMATTSLGTLWALRSTLEVEQNSSTQPLEAVKVPEFSEPTHKKGTPLMTSRSYVVIDAATHETLMARDAETPRSIASLSKLMSMMVYLDMAPDLNEIVEILPEDRRGARPAHTRLQAGWKLTVRDLLQAGLLASENPAVEALARSTGLSRAEFVGMMNRKAQDLGMSHSIFFDASGLDANNTSTANDVARMVAAAARYPLIHQIDQMPGFDATVLNSGRKLAYVNSNRLARYGVLDVVAGKTGYISDAGYCLTLSVRTAGRELLMVFLNAPSKAARFQDAARAAEWVSSNAVALASNP
ncbi:MAG: D-alanyl-D-alanine carboxypeptidase family protein [Myxococcota bacterium]